MHIVGKGLSAFITMLAIAPMARADALGDCIRASDPAARILACSEVIAGTAHSLSEKAVAYRNRGRARGQAGALDAAMADLNEAVKLNPTDNQAFTYRALARTGQGDIDGAIADYSEVIRLRPSSPIGFIGRGHAYLVKGAAQPAIGDFSEAVRLNPNSAAAYNNRGLAHKSAGDQARAIDDYTRAIVLNPIYALAYNNRGYVYEASGRKAEAIADYRRALLIDPSLVGAKDGLARLGSSGSAAAESKRIVREGKSLVERHCSPCHAVGTTGQSPNAMAPTFRSLHARHPMQGLREPLTRGIAAPHDVMPKFNLPDEDIDRVVAYINSLGGLP
jgi:tetratricopeptide (TPR) repeat protein